MSIGTTERDGGEDARELTPDEVLIAKSAAFLAYKVSSVLHGLPAGDSLQ